MDLKIFLLLFSGPDRRIYLPNGLLDRDEVPEYLNGEVPGE
jgi:light-harvesting complex II chlorophyll a/b binding protein 5